MFGQMSSRERTYHQSDLCRPGRTESTTDVGSPLEHGCDAGTDHAWPARAVERPLDGRLGRGQLGLLYQP